MKFVTAIFSSMSLLAPFLLSGQVIHELWDFKSAAEGVGLLDVANSAPNATGWNFDTTLQGDVVRSGIWRVLGKGEYTRKATRASVAELKALGPELRFEVVFTDWDLSQLEKSDALSFKLNDAEGETFALISLQKDSATTARIRWATFLDDGTSFYRSQAVSLTNDAKRVYAVELTAEGLVNYLIEDEVVHTSVSKLGSSSYAEALVVKQFSGDASGEVAGVASWGLFSMANEQSDKPIATLPESNSYGLLFGMLVLGHVLTRRRGQHV